uniref:Uncharacterized protein n=1 Tax=Timema poppense TaxID=170557 RepID=A0A7R9DQS7_TIMPO|nr:unnamed protein product [Timema poppensis]
MLKESWSTFEAVLFDVDNKSPSSALSCPPAQFLEEDLLRQVKTLIGDQGVFVLNLVCRMDQVRSNVIATLSSIFGSVCSYKLEQEVNEIVFCTNQGPWDQQQWRLVLEEAATKVNSLVKKKKLQSLDLVTTETFVGSLNVPV